MLTEIQQKLISELNDRCPFRLCQLPRNNARFSSPTACGMWSNREKTLYWCPERNVGHANTILFHELAHATMDIFNRPKGSYSQYFGTNSIYDREEVLAESVGRELTRQFGLATLESEEMSAWYIKQYAAGLIPEDYKWLDHYIPLVVNYIMEHWLPKFTMEQKRRAAA